MKNKILIICCLIVFFGCREIDAPDVTDEAFNYVEVKKDGKQISNYEITNLDTFLQECLAPESKLYLQYNDSSVAYKAFYRYPLFEKVAELKELKLSEKEILKEIKSYHPDAIQDVYFNYYISISPEYGSKEFRSILKEYFLSDAFNTNFSLINKAGDKIKCSFIHYESAASSINGVHSFLLGFKRPKDLNDFTLIYQDSLVTGKQIQFNYQGL